MFIQGGETCTASMCSILDLLSPSKEKKTSVFKNMCWYCTFRNKQSWIGTAMPGGSTYTSRYKCL